MWNTGMDASRTAAAVLLVLGMSSGSAAADPFPLRAKVVWAHAGRVYIASADSLPLEVGDLLTFQADLKTIASATVSAIHDGTLAIARVESGSLDRVKKLDRLRVFAERPPMRPLSVLRVGLPARATLLFACESPTLGLPFAPGEYRGDTLSERSYRFIRDFSVMVGAPPWPDTLLVRLFDETSDEEIALERGELDVAVFWPGELSTRMREDARWRDFMYGKCQHGLLVATLLLDREPGGYSARDSATFVSMNEEMFRHDLALLSDYRLGRRPEFSRRFEVDRACPGWRGIENFLNRAAKAHAEPGEPEPINVSFRGGTIDSHVSYEGPSRVLFAIRCPVVCTPTLRPYVRALGPDALAEMLDCWPARRAP
jgi:hypothetical protein